MRVRAARSTDEKVSGVADVEGAASKAVKDRLHDSGGFFGACWAMALRAPWRVSGCTCAAVSTSATRACTAGDDINPPNKLFRPSRPPGGGVPASRRCRSDPARASPQSA